MESIGKVVLMPKGTYSAGTTYSHLDWVRYNGKSWVCKQDNVIDVTPSEGATWTVLAEDATAHGLPSGGSANQVLAKASATDYDVTWVNQSGGGGGADEDLIRDTVGWTGKNLLENKAESAVKSDITYTVNADGTVNANGTASANAFLELNTFTLKAGDYILSQGADASTFGCIQILDTSYNELYRVESGTSKSFTLSADTAIIVRIRIAKDKQVSNVKIYPMLRHGDISDSTYEPYHETVKQTFRDAEVVEGKNLLKNVAYSQVINDVTFTVNADGSVLVNGTASATTVLPIATNVTTGNRDLIMSGCPAGGSSNGYSLKWRMSGSDIYDYGEGVDIPADSSTALSVEIRINNGYNASNLLFKPMLRLSTETDPTYEPYYVPVKDSKFDRSEQAVLGAKNLLVYPYQDGDTKVDTAGVTFTANSDGTISMSGTASGANAVYTFRSNDTNSGFSNRLKGKRVTLTGGLSGNIRVQLWIRDGDVYQDNGSGNTFVFPDITSAVWNLSIVVTNGTNASGITLKPMLRLASDPDSTYAPYAMTNKQLTDALPDYIEKSTYTDSSGTRTFAFTDARITTTGRYDYYCNVFGVAPTSVSTSNGSMNVKFKTSDNVTTCGIEIK